MARVATLVALMTLSLGCSAAEGAPEVRLDRSSCSRCGMLVSELVSAAATRGEEGVRIYDDLHCLLADREGLAGRRVGAPASPEVAAIWVFDHVSGVPLRAAEATFVHSRQLRTPMSGGIVAFASADAAAELAARVGGELLDWTGLLAIGPHAAAAATEVGR